MEFILSLLPLAIVFLVIYRVTFANTGIWQAIEDATAQNHEQVRSGNTSSAPGGRGDDLQVLLTRPNTQARERSSASHQAGRVGSGTQEDLRTALFVILSIALLYLLSGAPAFDLLEQIARALVGA